MRMGGVRMGTSQATGEYQGRGADLRGDVKHGRQRGVELGHHLGQVLLGDVPRPVLETHGGGAGGDQDGGAGARAGQEVQAGEGRGGGGGGGGGPRARVRGSQAHRQLGVRVPSGASGPLVSVAVSKHSVDHRVVLVLAVLYSAGAGVGGVSLQTRVVKDNERSVLDEDRRGGGGGGRSRGWGEAFGGCLDSGLVLRVRVRLEDRGGPNISGD